MVNNDLKKAFSEVTHAQLMVALNLKDMRNVKAQEIGSRKGYAVGKLSADRKKKLLANSFNRKGEKNEII